MKKTGKGKLVLGKETLRALDRDKLDQAAGGWVIETFTFTCGCNFTRYYTCKVSDPTQCTIPIPRSFTCPTGPVCF